jgi:hypothetical protein
MPTKIQKQEFWLSTKIELVSLRIPILGRQEVMDRTASCQVMTSHCYYLTSRKLNQWTVTEEIIVKGETVEGFWFWETIILPNVQWGELTI